MKNRGWIVLSSALASLSAAAAPPSQLGCAKDDGFGGKVDRRVFKKVSNPQDGGGYPFRTMTGCEQRGMGGLRCARVYRLLTDVKLYRVWDGRPAYADKIGRAMTQSFWPTKTAAQQSSVCTIKKGALIAVGPGNDVKAGLCDDATKAERDPNEHYPPDAALQVQVLGSNLSGVHAGCVELDPGTGKPQAPASTARRSLPKKPTATQSARLTP